MLGKKNKPTASQRVVGGDETGASEIDRCASNIEICLSKMSALIRMGVPEISFCCSIFVCGMCYEWALHNARKMEESTM